MHIQGLCFNYKNYTTSWMLIKRYNIYLHISNYNSSIKARACLLNYSYKHLYTYQRPVAYRRGWGLGCSTPPPEILKALQNRAKLNPIVKTVKNC